MPSFMALCHDSLGSGSADPHILEGPNMAWIGSNFCQIIPAYPIPPRIFAWSIPMRAPALIGGLMEANWSFPL